MDGGGLDQRRAGASASLLRMVTAYILTPLGALSLFNALDLVTLRSNLETWISVYRHAVETIGDFLFGWIDSWPLVDSHVFNLAALLWVPLAFSTSAVGILALRYGSRPSAEPPTGGHPATDPGLLPGGTTLVLASSIHDHDATDHLDLLHRMGWTNRRFFTLRRAAEGCADRLRSPPSGGSDLVAAVGSHWRDSFALTTSIEHSGVGI